MSAALAWELAWSARLMPESCPKDTALKKIRMAANRAVAGKAPKTEYSRTWGLLSNLEVWVEVRRHGDQSSEDFAHSRKVWFPVTSPNHPGWN